MALLLKIPDWNEISGIKLLEQNFRNKHSEMYIV